MAILVVDDSADERFLVSSFLQAAGYDVVTADSMDSTLEYLKGLNAKNPPATIDMILLDVLMPQHDGIEACRRIKALKQFHDVPVLMISGEAAPGNVQLAYNQGAIDYIRKPVIRSELLARVALVSKLQEEIKLRKEQAKQLQELTQQLEAANQRLQGLSGVDGLTELMNWGRFDELFEQEWKRAARENFPISLIFFALDDFKAFNETYGYLTGDECLQRTATAARETLGHPGHVVARYRGAEFVAMLPGMGEEDTTHLAELLRKTIEALDLGITLVLGVATGHPNEFTSRVTLLASAKEALIKNKQGT